MDSAILIRSVGIAAEDASKLQVADVLLESGKISRIGEGFDVPSGTREIDGRDRVLLPGLFDAHVHLREPGADGKETIGSGTEAAINGGVTGIVCMPNTLPAIDSGGMIQSVLDIAEKSARIPVHPSGCITKNRAGEELAALADMREQGAVMITDDGDPVSNPLVLRRALEYARDFDLITACHCEVKELTGNGCMNEGSVSYQLGLPGIPACSEEIGLARDLRLAQHTGAPIHIQHVTTARGMETIRRYKEDGVRVTCEVAPHHLIFNEGDIGDYDTNFKMNPPLRTPEDNAALIQGLIDGIFDIIATDHAPHSDFEKNRDFGSAPFGVTGLETALPSLHHYFVEKGVFGWDLLVKRFSAEPRRLIGLGPVPIVEGGRSECVLFNPTRATRFSRDFMQSKSYNTPFLNKELRGGVELVVAGNTILLDRPENES